MIKYDYEITVNGNQAKLNKDIYLFRGNKNVHYYFAVKNASFNFKGSTDLIEKTNAINAAVTVIKPNNVEVASAIAKVENGKIHLKVTEDLIDEEVEVGDFDLVFDLFDDVDGAVTIPKVAGQFHVLERPCTTPISELAVATNTTNEVDYALTDYAITTYAEPVASTNEDGTFAKKTWVAKEKITTAELNRMEEGISDVSSQCKDITKKIEQGGTGGGLSNDAKTLLISILQNAIYSTDQSSNITALQSALNTDITPCTITNNLSKCTNLNTNTSIAKGSNYTATIKPNTGYTLTNAIVTITMDGNDITSSAYSNGIITINNVTGNIVITCTAIQQSTTVTTYTITNNLTNVTTNNNNTTIEEHTNYSATLTADKGYTLGKIIVIMGGNDISNTTVLDGVISIESVTGDIVITANAIQSTTITSIGTFEKGTLSNSNANIDTSGDGASCVTRELNVGDIIGFADETLFTKYKFAIGLRTTAGWIKNSENSPYHTSNYTIKTQGTYGIMVITDSSMSNENVIEINNNFRKIN